MCLFLWASLSSVFRRSFLVKPVYNEFIIEPNKRRWCSRVWTQSGLGDLPRPMRPLRSAWVEGWQSSAATSWRSHQGWTLSFHWLSRLAGTLGSVKSCTFHNTVNSGDWSPEEIFAPLPTRAVGVARHTMAEFPFGFLEKTFRSFCKHLQKSWYVALYWSMITNN